MPISLTPEQEAEVRRDAAEHGYKRAEDYLAIRLGNIHAGASFTFETDEEFAHMVQVGIDSADRGELYTSEEVKEHLEGAKRRSVAKRAAA